MAERDNPVFITNEQATEIIESILEAHFDGKVSRNAVEAFSNMLEQSYPLTEKQLRWVQDIAVKLDLIAEPMTRAWSSLSPAEQARIRGRDVPTPPALLQKALRPPHRLGELKKDKI